MVLKRATLAAWALLATGAAFAQQGPPAPSLAQQPPDFVIRTFDKNSDGALEPSEVAGTPLQQDYGRMDLDRDGRLTVEEYQMFTLRAAAGAGR
jgi:hypothetical protein